jgi:two-component system phosphate regulon sensor histidine kinase PhoR
MAQIDAGVFTLEKQEIDIHIIINKVVQSFDPLINQIGGNITLALNADRPVMQGDETHITNMIYNLIDNACKYSHQSPEIVISTVNMEEGLCISVKDNGIGINKETQKHIFDKFYRAQTGNIHTVKGFGLGLSYVKSIAQAHNGRINLKSEIDKGSDFEVILPLI